MRLILGKKTREISDQELLDSIKRGNKSNVEILYKRCRRMIMNHVLNRNGDEQEAEDIVQETVIEAYEKIVSGKFELYKNTKLSTFMMGIATRKWSNHCRKKGKLVRVEDDAIQLEDVDSEWQLQEARFDQLKVTIEKLDEVCREIFRQRYWLKKKFDEITVANFMTVDALKMRSSRCHRQLKTMMYE
jgi:RNA polymerase sigma factor (sigma-70 family)